MKNLRKTGRTTRMLERAKRLVVVGYDVYVIADNAIDARRMQMLCGEAGRAINFKTVREVPDFDWDSMTLSVTGKKPIVLVDHHAIEDRYAHVLTELHAYDQDNANHD